MNHHENWEGNTRFERQMNDFKEVMEQCSLNDLGYKGPSFTWCNSRKGKARISERIDRYLPNLSWHQKFPHATVTHKTKAHSDNLSIWLDIEGPINKAKGKRRFRFKAM